MEGKLHLYSPPSRSKVLFEYTPPLSSSSSASSSHLSRNVLLFIGGLGDTFESVPYVSDLAAALPDWRVCHVQLSSAGQGWGMASLDGDCEEIALAVRWAKQHFQLPAVDRKREAEGAEAAESKVNVVLIGHSTGCQDVLHYLHSSPPSSGAARPPVQGAILQAPVSDRDALLDRVANDPERKAVYEHCLRFAGDLDEDERRDMIVPLPWSEVLFGVGRTPISVSRFLSLASPESPGRPAMDDLFSADATVEWLGATFGRLGSTEAFTVAGAGGKETKEKKSSMLIAIMGADEYVPAHVDKEGLLLKWKRAIEKDGTAVLDPDSGVVTGGKHNLRGKHGERKEARDDFVRRVKVYLGRLVDEADDRDADLGPEERLPHRPAL